MYIHDNRTVITLDAGGTNLVFGAMRGCEYDDMKRIGVTFSKLGASRAISAGAYAFALSKIDENND